MPLFVAPGRYRRVLSYIRVSSDDQERSGTSIDGQQDAHRAFCEANRLPPPVFYIEVESGSDLKIEARAEQLRLQRDAGPDALVLVTVLDRWSRDVPHAVATVRALVKRGVGWISIEQGIDASTPEGDDQLTQEAVYAERERRRIYRRTVGRRRELKAQGFYMEGALPLGYRREEGHRRPKTLVVEPVGTAIVHEIFDRCAIGQSIGQIVEHARVPAGRRAWDKKSILSILRNRVYLGEVQRSPGVWIPGRHEPIVPRELWERAHAGLATRKLGGRPPSEAARTASWMLRGLASCARCGARMSAAYRRGKGGAYIDYYVCTRKLGRRAGATCGTSYLRVDEVEPVVAALALRRLVELRGELARVPTAARAPGQGRDFEAARKALEARRMRVIDLHEHGTIEEPELKRRLARIDAEAGKLAAEEGAVARAAAAAVAARSPEQRRALLADVRALGEAWAKMPGAARREVVKRLASSIAVARDEEPRIVWRSIEELLEERPG